MGGKGGKVSYPIQNIGQELENVCRIELLMAKLTEYLYRKQFDWSSALF